MSGANVQPSNMYVQASRADFFILSYFLHPRLQAYVSMLSQQHVCLYLCAGQDPIVDMHSCFHVSPGQVS